MYLRTYIAVIGVLTPFAIGLQLKSDANTEQN